jgi:HD-GYP domain-containing protein (c-di-GMP phosphodiesterase class II)
LTAEEYEVIKQHPAIGEHIIEQVDFLQGARPIVRGHHEKSYGTGYPDGLRGEEIIFLAGILSVADYFDALISDRPYRKAYEIEHASQIIEKSIGKESDPAVAREFLQMTAALGGQRGM